MQLRIFAAVAAAVALWPAAAEAYPQFQFAKGANRCSMCHFSPSGGGLINKYGRYQASSSISQFGGDGDVFHGLLYEEPEWFQLGGDYRSVFLVRDEPEDGETLFFPMQADLYSRFAAGDFSLNLILGVRGQAREGRDSALSRFISREHYVMWQPEQRGPYVRAGRFYAPFGIRSQDHTTYVRRYLGFHTHEETYNLSTGWIEKKWEAHATAFTPVPSLVGGNGDDLSGSALYYEWRPGDGRELALGGQARVGFSADNDRYLLGGVAKYWLEPANVLFMGEVDLGLETFHTGPSRTQLAGYVGATYFPADGFMLGATAERYDQDLEIEGTYRDAYSLIFQYFPYAHFELMIIGKMELQGAYEDPVNMLMFQGHYYL